MVEDLDQFADAYASGTPHALDAHLTSQWYPKRLVKRAKGSSLLELGIGHGRAVRYLSRHFDRHMVVEGSTEVIERFRAESESERTVVVESFFEAFHTDETFDCISMGFVLEHVADPVLVLRRFSSFLRPDGSIFIAVPNATSMHRKLALIGGMMESMTALSDADRALGHRRYYDIDSLRRDVAAAGLVERSLEGIFLKPFTTRQLESLALSPKILDALMELGVQYPELSNSILMEVARRPLPDRVEA